MQKLIQVMSAIIVILFSRNAWADSPMCSNNDVEHQGKSDSKLIFHEIAKSTTQACVGEGAETKPILQYVYEYKQVYSTPLSRNIHLRAYVNVPSDSGDPSKRAAAVFFHGGAWRDGNPLRWFAGANVLASRGLVTAAFQYRIQGVHRSTPVESVEDAKSAIRWLRKHADKFGLDPNRIVAIGDSAGGHLALSTALSEANSPEAGEKINISSAPNAVVAYYPVVETRFKEIGCNSISPMDLLPNAVMPPILLVQGTADSSSWTPVAKSQAFCNAANLQSNQTDLCTFIPFPGKDHDFLRQNIPFTAGIIMLEMWLHKLGYIKKDNSSEQVNLGEACRPDEKQMSRWRTQLQYPNDVSGLW